MGEEDHPRVESLGAHLGEQLAPERIGENAVTIGDDGLGDAVELDDVVPERARHLRGVEWVAQRDEVRKLGEAINDDHGVEAFGLG